MVMKSLSLLVLCTVSVLFCAGFVTGNNEGEQGILVTPRALLDAATVAEQKGDFTRRDALLLRCAAASGDENLAQVCRSTFCRSLLSRTKSLAVLELGVCQLAVAHAPRDVVLLETTASILGRLDLHKESLPYLRNAYRIQHSASALYRVCVAYLRAGDCDHALSCTERLLSSDDAEVKVILSSIFDLLSITLSVCDAGNLTGNRAMIRGSQIRAAMTHGAGCESFSLNPNILSIASSVDTVIEGGERFGVLTTLAERIPLPDGIVERARNAGVNYSIPKSTSFSPKRVAIATLENVVLESEHGIWFRSSPQCEVYYNDHMLVNKIQRFFTAGGMQNENSQFPEIEEDVASAVQQVPNNYYHATVDIACRIAVLKEYVLNKHPDMPLVLPDFKIVRQIAQLFDVTKGRRIIWWNGTQPTKFRRVHIVDWRTKDSEVDALPYMLNLTDPWSSLYPPPSVVQLARSMVEPNLRTLDDLFATGDWRVVYLSRRDTNIRSVAEVEPAILDAIRETIGPEHLVVFEGETRTLKQQIEVMKTAVVVMGPHGAGFANMMWMPAGASVLLFPLVPTGDMCVLGLSAAVGLHYHEVPVVTSHYYSHYEAFSPSTAADDVVSALRSALSELGHTLPLKH